jgi:hypothetical protein
MMRIISQAEKWDKPDPEIENIGYQVKVSYYGPLSVDFTYNWD